MARASSGKRNSGRLISAQCLLALVLVPAAPALAKSGAANGGSPAYGGTQISARPVITGFSCLSGCSASSASYSLRPIRVSRDATLKIRGRNMSGVQAVLFTGAPGGGDDVRVDPAGVGKLSVDVSVPKKAASGPIVVVASNGTSSPSRQRLLVIDPPRGDNGDGDGHDGGGNGGGGGHGSDSLSWPIPRGPIFGAFGEQRTGHVHAGIDIASKVGTPVKAAGSGTVLFAGPSGGYGNYICIAHSSITTCYAHLADMVMTLGSSVSAGQVIGHVGMTGNSTGPHLHFEVRQGTQMYGVPVDPGRYLPGGVPAAVDSSGPSGTAHTASLRSQFD